MTADSDTGSVLYGSWFQYLSVGREARDRATALVQADPRQAPADCLIAILFVAFAVEAFVNELAEAAAMDVSDRRRTPSPERKLLRALAEGIETIEANHGSVEDKYQRARQILTGKGYVRGRAPYQDFQKLLGLRDLLAHPRPRERVRPGGATTTGNALISDLQQRGLTRTRAPKLGAAAIGMSNLLQIMTPKMAAWSYDSARKIIKSLGPAVPMHPLRTSATYMINEPTQRLPK